MLLIDLKDGTTFLLKGENKVYRKENRTGEGVVCVNSQGETIHFTQPHEVIPIEFETVSQKA